MKPVLPIALALLLAAAATHAQEGAATDGTAGAAAGGETQAPVPAADARDPAVVAKEVEQALRKADGVPAKDVVVSTHADTVVLTGEVGSEVTAARTLNVAEQAANGVRVSSQIDVRQDEARAARERTLKMVGDVEAALKRDARTANLGVAVSIDERQVIGLHGLVPSKASRVAAEDVAGRVAGVKQVRSHLVVPGE
jgi:osmotically-inducible protein OsmY